MLAARPIPKTIERDRLGEAGGLAERRGHGLEQTGYDENDPRQHGDLLNGWQVVARGTCPSSRRSRRNSASRIPDGPGQCLGSRPAKGQPMTRPKRAGSVSRCAAPSSASGRVKRSCTSIAASAPARSVTPIFMTG